MNENTLEQAVLSCQFDLAKAFAESGGDKNAPFPEDLKQKFIERIENADKKCFVRYDDMRKFTNEGFKVGLQNRLISIADSIKATRFLAAEKSDEDYLKELQDSFNGVEKDKESESDLPYGIGSIAL